MLLSAESSLSTNADTCNVVVFGETGVGKSSVVSLITGVQVQSAISPDAMGCTAEIIVYDHDIAIQNGILKVKLFDTPGLGEGSEGTVPADQARRILKKLLQKLKGQDGIHLLMYCVRGARKTTALRGYYDLLHSRVKGVPIVLVVTGLENQEPYMDTWWTTNQRFLSGQKMTFAGHACITAVTLRDDDPAWLKERREESCLAVRKLIERYRLPSGNGVHIGGDPDNPRNVIICDSVVPAPMNVCNIAGVTNGEWVRSMVAIRGDYYMFQRVTAPYLPAERSRRGVGFEPHLLIFYVDKDVAVDTQRTEVQKFCQVYGKFNVGLVVVVCGSDGDEDASSWWNAERGPLFDPPIIFRLTYLPREASERSEGAQGALKGLIWELSRTWEPRGSVVRDLLNRLCKVLTLGWHLNRSTYMEFQH